MPTNNGAKYRTLAAVLTAIVAVGVAIGAGLGSYIDHRVENNPKVQALDRESRKTLVLLERICTHLGIDPRVGD